MDRKQVLIPEEQTLRQRDFERKIRELHAQRGKSVRALVDTFGCQQNVADSQHIMGMLEAMGCTFVTAPEEADIVVLNTCAIRDHAEKRVYGNLGALTHTKKANPAQVICLCGCMAQRPEVAEKVRQSYRHVDLVFGPQALWKFPELLYQVYTQRRRVFSVADEHGAIAEGMPVVREGRTRAWVSIMYGCNNFCSYCIVPYVRGRERSREPHCVLQEVRELVAAGYKAITLLGQNVDSYGNDLDLDYHFPDLLEDIDKIPGEYLIRFMSSHPKDATNHLFDVMAKCSHVAKQLHLPFQSGNDRVLKAMNRGYTAEQYLELVHYAKAKMGSALSITSDVIVGFPGETYEEFQDTLSLVKAVGATSLFTFIYSPRQGTPAAKMDDPVSHKEKARWMAELLALQEQISAEQMQLHRGETFKCFVSGKGKLGDNYVAARTDGNLIIEFEGDDSLIGSFQNVKVIEPLTYVLRGELERN